MAELSVLEALEVTTSAIKEYVDGHTSQDVFVIDFAEYDDPSSVESIEGITEAIQNNKIIYITNYKYEVSSSYDVTIDSYGTVTYLPEDLGFTNIAYIEFGITANQSSISYFKERMVGVIYVGTNDAVEITDTTEKYNTISFEDLGTQGVKVTDSYPDTEFTATLAKQSALTNMVTSSASSVIPDIDIQRLLVNVTATTSSSTTGYTVVTLSVDNDRMNSYFTSGNHIVLTHGTTKYELTPNTSYSEGFSAVCGKSAIATLKYESNQWRLYKVDFGTEISNINTLLLQIKNLIENDQVSELVLSQIDGLLVSYFENKTVGGD